ncbi:MAG TPA: outer membrane beta-barrel protein [Bacteroidia bacterium]|jgi:hypothetical protein|nr:outer membrane beta-barrel protein [Bacteroidia bacterium]
MKTKLLLLFFITSLGASAQERGFSIEPLIGYGLSQAVENSRLNSGGEVGLGFAYMFNQNIGLSTGVQVQQYTSNTNIHDSEDACPMCMSMSTHWKITSVSATYNFAYLEIPLNIRFIASKTNKTGFFCEAGVVLGYYIAGNESGSGLISSDWGDVKDGLSIHGIDPNASKINLQTHQAIGVIIPINQRFSIITDASFNEGLTNVGNSSNDYVTINGANVYYYGRNNSFSTSSNIADYGTNFSLLLNARLNIKLGALQPKTVPTESKAQ